MSRDQKPISNTMEDIRQSGLLKVGLTGDYAPYSYFNGANFEGIDVEMAKGLAQNFDVQLEIVKTEWKTLEKDLTDGKFHIAMGGISVNDHRKNYGYFSIPVLEDGKMPIVRCEDRDKYQSIEDINQPSVRVIVNPGGTNYRFAKDHFTQANLTIFTDNREIFREIAENRADVMVTDGLEVQLQSSHFPGVLCPANAPKFNSFEKAYLLPKDEQFRNEVNTWLSVAKDDLLAKAQEDYSKHKFEQLVLH